jgi:hypothetical protein
LIPELSHHKLRFFERGVGMKRNELRRATAMSSDPPPAASGGSYTVARPRKYELQELRQMNELLQGLGAAKLVKLSILAAGVAAVCEIIHLGFLALRFFVKF